MAQLLGIKFCTTFRPCNLAGCKTGCSTIIDDCFRKSKQNYNFIIVPRGESRFRVASKKFQSCVEEYSSNCYRFEIQDSLS